MFKVFECPTGKTLEDALNYYMDNNLPAGKVASIASMTSKNDGTIVLILSLTDEV